MAITMEQEIEATPDALEQESVGEDTQNPSLEELEKAKELAENYKRRAEKAEEKAKKYREAVLEEEPQEEETPDITNNPEPPLSRDEAILIAQGFSDEQLEYAKRIAQVEGLSLVEATKTEQYRLWEQVKEKEAQAEQAQMGASKGSGKRPEKVRFDSPNISRDQHKELYSEYISKLRR